MEYKYGRLELFPEEILELVNAGYEEYIKRNIDYIQMKNVGAVGGVRKIYWHKYMINKDFIKNNKFPEWLIQII